MCLERSKQQATRYWHAKNLIKNLTINNLQTLSSEHDFDRTGFQPYKL